MPSPYNNPLCRQAADIITRMKEVTGSKTDNELGNIVGVSKTTVASWRKRNSVPLDKIFLIAQKFDSSIEYIVSRVGGSKGGGLHTTAMTNSWAYGLAIYFYERCRESIKYGDTYNTCLWWGKVFPHAVQHFEFEISEIESAGEKSMTEAMEIVRDTIDALQPSDFLARLDRWAATQASGELAYE